MSRTLRVLDENWLVNVSCVPCVHCMCMQKLAFLDPAVCLWHIIINVVKDEHVDARPHWLLEYTLFHLHWNSVKSRCFNV